MFGRVHHTLCVYCQGPNLRHCKEISKKKILKTVFANLEMYTKPSDEYLNDTLFGLIFAILYAT